MHTKNHTCPSCYIGLDIGGTKMAAALLSCEGEEIFTTQLPTPKDYPSFLDTLKNLLGQGPLGQQAGLPVGLCLPGAYDAASGILGRSSNLPFLNGRNIASDFKESLGRPVRIANDSAAMALAEAVDGAGRGNTSVLGYILGTGVGSGFVYDGRIISGKNGLASEIGHLPMPLLKETDSPVDICPCCGDPNCIEKRIAGPALEKLYTQRTGKQATPKEIAALTQKGEREALAFLDTYYDLVARATLVALYAFDPDIIVLSGGLMNLPGLYEAVPEKWEKYSFSKRLKTKIAPAQHGPMAGIRGAAWLWRDND